MLRRIVEPKTEVSAQEARGGGHKLTTRPQVRYSTREHEKELQPRADNSTSLGKENRDFLGCGDNPGTVKEEAAAARRCRT